MKIVFMGTPDIAAASLKALIDADYDIAAVFTQPDKPRNRGMKLGFSPVKELAVEHGIPVYQPASLRDGEAEALLRSIAPDLIAVVAYGRIIPTEIIEIPPLGCINIHASLLPKYRGSAPVQWSVLNGDKYAGLTSMHIAPALDSGDMIYTAKTEIGEFETSGELFDRLCPMGGELLVKTIRALEDGTAPREPQNEAEATLAPMLSRDMSPIDWNKTPREIVKHICGLHPWPCATMTVGGTVFKVHAAAYTENHTDKAPGSVVSAGKQGLEMACANGETLVITQLQAPGGKRMAAADYLRGHPIEVQA
ncbi:MAG: methionyl-tRNA formyltransferase [Candidatus Heteroscillospira sp.]|jgi:methionyl-tRNA formyltransferase